MRNGRGRRGLVGVCFIAMALGFAGCEGLNMPVPGVPADVTLNVLTSDTIAVQWKSVMGATDYQITYGTTVDVMDGTLEISSAASEGENGTRGTDVTGLTAGSTYYFSVRAGNNGGWGDASAPKHARTPPSDGGLQVPQITEAAALGPGSVSLTWEVIKADWYYVYRAENADNPEAYIPVASIEGNTYTDLVVMPGMTYYYRVSAITGSTESGKSEAVSVKTPTESEEVPVPPSSLSAALGWLKNNVENDGSYVVELTSDETLKPVEFSYTEKTNITVILKSSGENRTITASGSDSLLKVASGVTLVLGPGITLMGDPTLTNSIRALVYVSKGSKLIMREGSKITGNTVSFYNSQGGGVYVAGAFIMDGGEISGNAVSVSSRDRSAYGGGVYVHDDATFMMNGGRITRNSVLGSGDALSAFGGGVYINHNGAFVMNGGEISGNSVESRTTYVAYGGGVAAEGIFTMNGGVIIDNSASATVSSAYGGGVHSAGGFTLKNGEIRGNRATSTSKFISCGGGVHSDGGVLMSGGKVNGNTASSTRTAAYGGGVYVGEGAVFEFGGGEICDNTISSGSTDIPRGGGAYIGGDFYMTQGKIGGNTVSAVSACVWGGGVYAAGEFIMDGGEISGNTLDSSVASEENASACGAGIFAGGGFIMEGGEIKGNKSAKNLGISMGGGVFIYEGASLIIYGGTISGNGASYGGGVYVNETGSLVKAASASGGTIYGADGSPLGNVAANGNGFGHAVYAYGIAAGGENPPESVIKIRDTTAGPDVKLNSDESGGEGGWE